MSRPNDQKELVKQRKALSDFDRSVRDNAFLRIAEMDFSTMSQKEIFELHGIPTNELEELG